MSGTLSSSTPYRYLVNNDDWYTSAYGYLYNWTAAMNNQSTSAANPSGRQGICPDGWHIPSRAEVYQLNSYLESNQEFQCGGNSSLVAKALATVTPWNTSNVECAPGYESENNSEVMSFTTRPEIMNCGTVSDVDGNVYNTIAFGNQCWMAENLRDTIEGESIGHYSPATEFSNPGFLYSWESVMHGATSSNEYPSGVRGICPLGWHLPSAVEWQELKNTLSDAGSYSCSGNSQYIASAMASNEGWRSTFSNSCAAGYCLSCNNATGFNALPVGYYVTGMGYDGYQTNAFFWTSTAVGGTHAWYFRISYDSAVVGQVSMLTTNKASVRCVMD